MKGPRLTDTQSRGMKDGTTGYATGTPCPVKDPRGHATASGERHRLTAGDRPFDDGVSPVISEILLVAVTILLAAVAAASLFGLFSDTVSQAEPSEILQITSVSHYSESGKLTYAGIITLKNIGYEEIQNREHGMYISVNGERTRAVIETLSSSDFIPTHHYGVRLIKGAGPHGNTWESGAFGVIDVSDKMIQPGDLVTVEVYRISDGEIISCSQFLAPSVFEE